MKKFYLIVLLFILSCQKISYDIIPDHKNKIESCDFLKGKYNAIGRMSSKDQKIAARKGVGESN